MIAIRALTVHRPWASLILAPGGKDVENRSWDTKHRGLLVVHAGQAWDQAAARHPTALGLTIDADQPVGYLGVVDLADVHHHRYCGGSLHGCRDWGEPDMYHWALANPRRFPASIPGPGRQRLFTPPPAVLDAVAALTGQVTR